MKKYLYYGIPFLAFPLISLLWIYLDDILKVEMNFIMCIIGVIFVSIVIGNLSPINKLFDYSIPAISAIAWISTRFIFGFVSESDIGTRFHLSIAIHWAFMSTSLLFCIIIVGVTFLASLKPIRIINILKHNK